MIDFIGIGAQKSGTSWVHACLFEHPEVCSPIKEIHFFSRERFARGRGWYEDHFKTCESGKKKGEFSTSYLYSPSTAEKIALLYPEVRIIAILREPTDRAYSQYRNAIKAGEIVQSIDFSEYFKMEKSCMEQGLYTGQLERYYTYFNQEQVLVLLYEESKENPEAFIQKIYRHIGVDDTFVPPSLNMHINVARTPKHTGIDKVMHIVAEWLRRHGASSLVHIIKRSGMTDAVRKVNTKEDTGGFCDLSLYRKYFSDDIRDLSSLLECDVNTKWNYEKG